MPQFPPVPPAIKLIAHFLKVAEEHDDRNEVVSYWCRMYACQTAMKAVSGPKPPEVTKLLIAIMDWLEQSKKEHADLDGIHNETCAQALIEEYALQLFSYADAQDQAANFGKNVVKAFYTAGILMDILQQFGQLSEDILEKRKYAKWKAAYIHNCLKCGEQPIPGPPREEDDNLIPKDDEPDVDAIVPPNPTVTFEDTPAAKPVDPVFPTINANIPPSDPTPGPFTLPELPSVPSTPSTLPVFPSVAPSANPPSTSASTAHLNAEKLAKAQKYCKWAESALNYEDVKNAVDNLQKALHLLQFGKEL